MLLAERWVSGLKGDIINPVAYEEFDGTDKYTIKIV